MARRGLQPSTVTSSFLLCAVIGLTRVGKAPYGHCPNPVRELLMPHKKLDLSDRSKQRQSALSRWEDEGGAGPRRLRKVLMSNKSKPRVPQLAMAELVQLRIRVIALENLVIGLLAEASDRQLDLAREMAVYISPRPNFTRHRSTIHAAAQMIHLVERAAHFRSRAGDDS